MHEGHHHHDHGADNGPQNFEPPYSMVHPIPPRPASYPNTGPIGPQNVGQGNHDGRSGGRQLPFFSKIVGAIIIAAPLLYLAHIHLDYSSEAHRPKDDNPISYLAYGLKHADKDLTSVAQTAGAVSDHVVAGLEDRQVPTSAQDNGTTAPRRTIGSPVSIELCVPIDLINYYQSWDRPVTGSKMSDFKSALGAFLVASGDPRVQYRIRNGAFESFNPASNPADLVYGVNAGSACPADEKPYTIPAMR